jgi:hypothetical protein
MRIARKNPVLKVQPQASLGERGILMAEFSAAIAIFALVVFTSAAPLVMEQAVIRRETARAVAIEIVDGEMELLAAGAWKKFPVGSHEYQVSLASARTLPPGRFVLDVTALKVTLEWREVKPSGREISRVSREFKR